MPNFRLVDLYVNVQQSVEVGSDGRQKATALRLFNKESVLLRIRLVDDANTAYPLTSNLTLKLGIDNSFDQAHADPVVALHASFNVAGDWSDAAYGTGKLSVRASLNTSELATAMGTTASLTFYMQLWATPPDGDAFLVFKIPVTIEGVTVLPTGSATPAEGETYVDTAMLAAVIEQFTQDGIKKVRIKNSDGVTVAVFGE